MQDYFKNDDSNYSKIRLVNNPGHHLKILSDRRDNSQGYTSNIFIVLEKIF